MAADGCYPTSGTDPAMMSRIPRHTYKGTAVVRREIIHLAATEHGGLHWCQHDYVLNTQSSEAFEHYLPVFGVDPSSALG